MRSSAKQSHIAILNPRNAFCNVSSPLHIYIFVVPERIIVISIIIIIIVISIAIMDVMVIVITIIIVDYIPGRTQRCEN